MSERANDIDDKMKRRRIRQFFPTVDDQHFNDIWNKELKTAFQSIFNKDLSDISFEGLYRFVYTFVSQKYGEKLYKAIEELLIEHLLQRVRQSIPESSSMEFLPILKLLWNDYHLALRLIRSIVAYMDRVYVAGQKLLPTYDLGLRLFRDHILRDEVIHQRLLQAFVEMIDNDRWDSLIDQTTLKDIYQMFIILGMNSRCVYEEDFQQPLSQQLTLFYTNQCEKLLSEYSISEYIRHVSTLMDGVVQWTTDCFDDSMTEGITKILVDQLITKPRESIVEKIQSSMMSISDCLSHYLREQQISNLLDLRKTFNPILRISMKYDQRLAEQIRGDFKYLIDSNDHVANHLSSLIDDQLDQGIQSLDDQEMNDLFQRMILLNYSKEKDLSKKSSDRLRKQFYQMLPNTKKEKTVYVQFISNLLHVKDIFDAFLQTASNEDKTFQNELKLDLEEIVNSNKHISEYLSLFLQDQQTEDILDRLMMLFDYIREKDRFERWFHLHLAQRLISNKPMSDEMTNAILLRLKIKCSPQLTYQLERMFKDILVSQTRMDRFLKEKANEFLPKIDLSVKVLTTNSWPYQSNNYRCNLTGLVKKIYQAYVSFYLNLHNGRCLTLQSTLGTADLTATFYGQSHEEESLSTTAPFIEKRKHLLQVSTHQMIILMLFNMRESYSYEEIHQETNIEKKHLKRALRLLMLTEPAQNILLKDPPSDTIAENDRFSINDSFTSKSYRVKVKSIQEKPVEHLEEEAQKKIDDDRRFEIDATIVRTMKSHKIMKHTQLMSEVMHQLKKRFPVNVQLFKSRIERLIELDFLSRSKDDTRVYHYVI